MPRKKALHREWLLTHPIRTRVTEKTFDRLKEMAGKSNCHSVGELARKILSRERIVCFHKDVSMNGPMEELALIRKELKSIGININQQTRYFHASATATERSYYVMKTMDLYRDVEKKVERLLVVVSALAEKWLQE